MVRTILKGFRRHDAAARPLGALDWETVERMVRRLPRKTSLVLPKANLGVPPPYPRSRRGRPRGALRQFRDQRRRHSLHVKEFARHWVLHLDRFNPHAYPLRHLAVDWGYRRFVHLLQLLDGPSRPQPVEAE